MKNIAFVGAGLGLFVTICIVVRASMPMAKLSVLAVRPTGKFCTNWNYLANEEVMPVWQFAVTNIGGASASWSAYEMVKLPSGVSTALKDWPLQAPGGVIGPGDTRFVEMVVPADSNVTWCAFVEYQSIPRSLEQKLFNSMGGISLLRSFLPANSLRKSFGTWHSTTNITTAH